jgi:regulator of nucleoside diphosphate kinase
MISEANQRYLPSITVLQRDYNRLILLADAMQTRLPNDASRLALEMDRAQVVGDDMVGATVVHMGSRVRYRTDQGIEREVTVVFPGEADVSQGKISILTPMGTALIGLSKGQSITWTSRYGQVLELQVLSIFPRRAARGQGT